MTVRLDALRFAEAGEAAGLAAFLGRLVRWDRAAAVRLRARAGALAVFGHPAAFGVLAVRTVRLAEDPALHVDAARSTGADAPAEEAVWDALDVTVSAGELLEGVDEQGARVQVPRAVTGPPWAGVLPPRGGWRQVRELPWREVRVTASEVIAEFRERSEALPVDQRTRAHLDALAEEIWSRPLGQTALPLRAVHAAQALGFLHRSPAAAPGASGASGSSGAPGGAASAGENEEDPLTLLSAGPWLRLRTPFGSIVVRRKATPGLSVTPVR